MTIQEIEEFVKNELSVLDLNEKQIEKYITFIKKLDNHNKIHNREYIDARDLFIDKFEKSYEFFKLQGFKNEKALELTKNVIIEWDRKNIKEKLSFLRTINLEESVITSTSLSLRFNLEKAHAKKMYLVDLGDKKAQTRHLIIHETDERFNKKFGVNINQLVKKYPITEETKEVWMKITCMSDEDFLYNFGMSREQLSYIYPTTKEEVAALNLIAKLTNEEIEERYGLTRYELLSKRPLKNDTLKALKSLKHSSDKAIQSTFNKSREEVLSLRTITTEMIKIAQQEKIKLKRSTYTKEELLKQFKTMKKGTI